MIESQKTGKSLNLTELEFWDRYWSAKKEISHTWIPHRYLFTDVLSRMFTVNPEGRFLEIGGFPGFYSIWFTKYLCYHSSLIDIYLMPEIVDSLTQVNGTAPITLLQGDIFSFNPSEKYDVVMSAGLIEHFADLPAIVERHGLCLHEGGKLIICVPNFLGLNGLLQKLLDRNNYEAHNLAAMDIKTMRTVLKDQGFKDINASYYGGFGIWIEEAKFSSPTLAWILKILNYARVPFNIIGLNTRFFSPYIMYTATR